jgi:hypothetical protein
MYKYTILEDINIITSITFFPLCGICYILLTKILEMLEKQEEIKQELSSLVTTVSMAILQYNLFDNEGRGHSQFSKHLNLQIIENVNVPDNSATNEESQHNQQTGIAQKLTEVLKSLRPPTQIEIDALPEVKPLVVAEEVQTNNDLNVCAECEVHNLPVIPETSLPLLEQKKKNLSKKELLRTVRMPSLILTSKFHSLVIIKNKLLQ